MGADRGKKIIRRIARENRVDEITVRKEMERAIAEGYQNPLTRQEWNRLFGTGHMPTPEEFIAVIAKNVKKGMAYGMYEKVEKGG